VNPFAYLGLPRDADERSIKRAYAQRLREVRPDTDAEGFQALHSAYKAALELCRRRPAAHAVAVREVNELVAVDVEDVARSEPTVSVTWPMPASAAPAAGMPLAVLADAEEIAVPPSGPQVTVAWSMPTLEARPLASPAPIPEPVVVLDDEPAAAPPSPHVTVAWSLPPGAAVRSLPPQAPRPSAAPFDFLRFVDAFAEVARRGHAPALAQWLRDQPALWSIENKTLAGRRLVAALEEREPPMPDECFDAALAFFDLHHVLAGLDAVATLRLRRRLALKFELAPENFSGLVGRMRKAPAVMQTEKQVRAMLSALSTPVDWRTMLRHLHPAYPAEVAKFVQRLSLGRPEDLPPPIDAATVGFWLDAANRAAIRRPRLIMGALRCAALVAALALFAAFGAVLKPDLAWLGAPIFALVLSLGWVALLGGQAVYRWQTAQQSRSETGYARWLRLGLIPALAAAAVLLTHVVNAAVGAMVVVFSLWLAVARYRRRAGRPKLQIGNWWRLVFLLPAARGAIAALFLLAQVADVGAGIVLAIWLADLWKQRHFLRAA